jgi:FSR family fosmidomycin resistance protein-like MFS transporter
MAVGETEPASETSAEGSLSVEATHEAGHEAAREGTVVAVLFALSASHFLNDTIQSLLPSMYPILAESYALSLTQVGLITFAFQGTGSLLQPIVGLYTDRHPKPYSLAIGMGITLLGLCLLAVASSFPLIVLSAVVIGTGSAVFHPESSRVARMASGGRHGFAQSLFQVGGNAGSAIGPLLAAFIVVPRGQGSVAWFSLAAVCGIALLFGVGRWYHNHLSELRRRPKAARPIAHHGLSRGRVAVSIAILLLLIFSKYFYLTSLTSYYTFYLIDTFGVSVEWSQIYLFVFLGAVAAGTLGGGPVGDRLGFKTVIWGSILGVLPFTLLLPHVNLFWTVVLTVPIGLILASAFSAIMVYAQELLPARVGMVAGLFFGFAFGMGGIGSAVLGYLADHTSIQFVYFVCSFLPAIGLLTAFLPNFKSRHG